MGVYEKGFGQESGTEDKKRELLKKALRLAILSLATSSFSPIGTENLQAQTFGGVFVGQKAHEKHISEEEQKKEDKRKKKIENLQKKLKEVVGEKLNLVPLYPRLERSEPPAILGELESADGKIGADVVKSLFEKMPKGWIRGEVVSIKHSEESINNVEGLDAAYKSAGAMVLARCGFGAGAEITFYKESDPVAAKNIIEDLYHEVGHANDWVCDSQASLEDRLELLSNILDRLSAADRYRSGYVEKLEDEEGLRRKKITIQRDFPERLNYSEPGHPRFVSPLFGNNLEEQEIIEGKRTNAFLDAQEYWAEITRAYFLQPEEMNVADFRLVNNWVKKTDPKYDAFKEAKARRKTIKELVKKMRKEREDSKKSTER